MSNTRRNIHLGKWADFINIAYSTRPTVPWEQRKVEIEVSNDCVDNLAGLFGLFQQQQDEFTTMSNIQHQLLDFAKIQEYVMKSNPHPGLFGRLDVKQVDGTNVFDIKFR